jgi:hypothetical protein
MKQELIIAIIISLIFIVDFDLYLRTPNEFKDSLKYWEKIAPGSGIVVWLRYKQHKKK